MNIHGKITKIELEMNNKITVILPIGYTYYSTGVTNANSKVSHW